MKKGVLSLIVICITILSVFIMLYNNNLGIEKVNESKLIPNIKVDAGEKASEGEKNTNISNNKPNKVQEQSIIPSSNNNKNTVKVEQQKNNLEKNNSANNNVENNEIVMIQKTENSTSTKSDITETKEVNPLKISMQQIGKEMSLVDKAKLIYISNKISATDYAKINNYLKEESQGSIKKVIALLRTRLSSKDYQKFMEVAVKYVSKDEL